MTLLGSNRGTNKKTGTKYGGLRPGYTDLELLRIALGRDRAKTSVNTPYSAGGGGGASRGQWDTGVDPPGALSEYETVLISIADNDSETLNLGLITAYWSVTLNYLAKRNYGTPTFHHGRLTVFHDGTNVDIGHRKETSITGTAGHGLTLTGQITSGMLQLVVATSNATPDATCDFYVQILSHLAVAT